MVRIPTHRVPTHPGEMLQEEFLTPLGFSSGEVARAIHVPEQRVNAIIQGHAAITPSIALRLAKVFGLSADFWLNIQLRWDVYQVQQEEDGEIATIEPLVRAA